MDSKEGFDGQRDDDGLHHGVPFLSPDAAGAAGLGLCAGALALLVLPGKRRVLAISPEDPGQRNCRGAPDLAVGVHALARGAPQRGLSALRA